MKQCSFFAIGASLLFAASCSFDQLAAPTSEQIKEVNAATDDLVKESRLPDTPEVVDTVRTKSEIWLGNSSSKVTDSEPLPARFETENAITIVTNQELGLFEMAKKITELSGLLVRVDDKLLDGGSGNSGDAISLNYHGKLSGLLDQISSRLGLYWKYKRGVLTFYEMETRSYTIYALPVESSVSTDVSNNGSSGNGETMGTSTSDISNTVTLEIWNQIEDTINNMLPGSASMSISSTTGMITVTAPPDTLAKVGRYVRDINEKLARQVAVSVHVLQVTLDEAHNYGLDLSLALGKLGSWTEAAFQGASSLGTATAGVLSGGLTFSNGKVKIGAIIQALSTQGQVSAVTTATVTTMNNKVAPVQVSESKDYVSKLTTTVTSGTSNNNVSYTTETDTLNTGFTMNVLPRILDHGRLLLMFSASLSTDLGMEEYTLPASEGQDKGSILMLPHTATRGFTQELIMKSGSTLVVTGFENAQDQLSKEGVGGPDFMLLGGSKTAKKARQVLVIVITPEVLVSPLSPETRVND